MSTATSLMSAMALLGAACIGGIFFTFSNFVMPALARLPSKEGRHAMQAINITVLNIGFLSVFIGTGAFGLAATVTLWITAGLPNAVMTLVASVIYLVGVIGVTGLGNVPLNESLAHQTDAAKTADEQWERYLVRWTRLNSLRATASLVAAALLVVAWPVGG